MIKCSKVQAAGIAAKVPPAFTPFFSEFAPHIYDDPRSAFAFAEAIVLFLDELVFEGFIEYPEEELTMIGPGTYDEQEFQIANLKAHLFMGVVALEAVFLDVAGPYDEECVRRLQTKALDIVQVMRGPVDNMRLEPELALRVADDLKNGGFHNDGPESP